MDYITRNKAAWEEAFDHRRPNWGDDNHKYVGDEGFPFLDAHAVAEIRDIGLSGKAVAQFCCNNGRELLSLMQLGADHGVGFDIAENIVRQARDTASKAGIQNCEFVCCNVLDIDSGYRGAFDFLFFTIGAITWIEDLGALFRRVSDCLRPGGTLLIHDFHPLMNMLPIPGEPAFRERELDRIAYPYFREEPFVENDGISYLSGRYDSKTFTSFAHTMSGIVNGITAAGMGVVKLNEYDYDVGLTDAYDHRGYPLSYLLVAEKR